MPCTESEPMTLNYLVDALNGYGLSPANGESFLQEVPLVEIDGKIKDQVEITIDDMVMPLVPGKDIVAVTERPVESIGIQNSELIFCGYGIVAPEYEWNDYEGVDLKGKTAVVLVNDPGLGSEDSTFFKGETMTYYGRWTYKYEEADRLGLDGILIIHEPAWPAIHGLWSNAAGRVHSYYWRDRIAARIVASRDGYILKRQKSSLTFVVRISPR